MKITHDLREFRLRAGPLMDLDFALIDITPNTRLGFFERSRLAELVAFCQENPEYHIISFLKHAPIEVNAAVEAAAFFMLGQGDSDPELMYVPNMDKKILTELRVLEFDAS